MGASLAVGLMARPWARRAAAIALVALTTALFILNLRRTAERAGRAAERHEMLEGSSFFAFQGRFGGLKLSGSGLAWGFEV